MCYAVPDIRNRGHPMRPLLLGLLLVAALWTSLSPATDQTSQPMSEPERANLRAEVRAYLLENPEILVEMIALLEERQQAGPVGDEAELIASHAAAIFDDGFSFVAGDPEGDVTIVEFVDYQCGFCRRSHPEMRELVASDGDIRLIVKEMPILGPGSERASRAAIATLMTEGPQAYAAVNEALMRLEGPVTDASLGRVLTGAGLDAAVVLAAAQDEEVTRRLAETRDLAEELAISGTPTFVFGSEILRGYVPLAAMREKVAAIRAAN